MILRTRSFRGPNIHAREPVLEITLEASVDVDAFGRRVLDLQTRAGESATFLHVEGNVVAVACPIESVGQYAVEVAARLSGSKASEVDVAAEVQRLKDLIYQQKLPASTAVVYNAARARGIPARRLSPEYGRFLLLGQGSKQQRCQSSEPNTIGAVARTASTDKYLAKEIMRAAGVPVPVGKIVRTVEDAWAAASELGLPVAIKPQDSDLAIGVSLDLRDRAAVEKGFQVANEHSTWVLVERFAPGIEHRVLVVDGKIVAVTKIDPPHVIGDGKSTVAELVKKINSDPRRGEEGSGAPWNKLKLDDVAEGVLAAQGQSLTSVPAAGTRVLVRRNPPYFKAGGNLVDLTDRIHPTTAAHAAAAAQALQLRVAGLDVVAVDIAEPLEPQRGVVVEINAGPGLWLHMAPWAESPRPVGEAIVASLFPPGDDGRIPVIAVVGLAGEAVPDALWKGFSESGLRAGSVGANEIEANGRRWPVPAGTPHERAQVLFQFPALDVALLRTTPEELLEAGFGNDVCDAALVLPSVANNGSGAAKNFEQVLQNALKPGGGVFRTAEEVLGSLNLGPRK